MIGIAAAALVIFMLSTLTVIVRRGLNEIIRGLESLDERLARMQSDKRSGADRMEG